MIRNSVRNPARKIVTRPDSFFSSDTPPTPPVGCAFTFTGDIASMFGLQPINIDSQRLFITTPSSLPDPAIWFGSLIFESLIPRWSDSRSFEAQIDDVTDMTDGAIQCQIAGVSSTPAVVSQITALYSVTTGLWQISDGSSDIVSDITQPQNARVRVTVDGTSGDVSVRIGTQTFDKATHAALGAFFDDVSIVSFMLAGLVTTSQTGVTGSLTFYTDTQDFEFHAESDLCGNAGAVDKTIYDISGLFFQLDPSPENCRVNDDGTGSPATINDPIGFNRELIAGRNLTQASTGSKPLLMSDGGKHYLHYDGSDDVMSSAAFGPFAQPLTHVIGINLPAVPSAVRVLSGPIAPENRNIIQIGSTGAWQMVASTNNAKGAAATGKQTLLAEFNTSASRLFIDGTESGTSGNAGSESWGSCREPSNGALTVFLGVDIYFRLVYARLLTSEEKAIVAAYADERLNK